MSDAIIGRSMSFMLVDPLHTQTKTQHQRILSDDTHFAVAVCLAVDEMGVRIDELENSIGELMAQVLDLADARQTRGARRAAFFLEIALLRPLNMH